MLPGESLPAAPTGLLPPGSEAVTTVSGLRVRSGPPGSVDFDHVRYLLPPNFPVLVHAEPSAYIPGSTSADGRGWYYVHVGGRDIMSHVDGIDGWVADGESGLEYLAIQTAPCPGPRPSVDDLIVLAHPGSPDPEDEFTAWDRLACYGNAELELEGLIDLLCQGAEFEGVYEPAFLAYPTSCIGLSGLPLKGAEGVLEQVERGDLVRLHGHFDDPLAPTCSIQGVVPPPDPAFVVWFCREQFVVDDVEVTGHQELPPIS